MICSDPCYAEHHDTSMNFTNSTCTSAGSINQQEPAPVWICVVLILLNVFILIGTLIGFSFLLRFIMTSKKKDRTPGHAFFFGISMVSLLGSLIGKCLRFINTILCFKIHFGSNGLNCLCTENFEYTFLAKIEASVFPMHEDHIFLLLLARKM